MKRRIAALALGLTMLVTGIPMHVQASEVGEGETQEDIQVEATAEVSEYKGLTLNAEGLYESTDSNGEVVFLDPSDPEFDKYVLGDFGEDDMVLSQGAMNTQTTTGFDLATYTSPSSQDGKSVHRGVDVSKWQGTVNWAKLKEQGVEFAIIKVAGRDTTDGELYLDPKFIENIQGASNAGIRIGTYFFSQALNTQEAIDEANCMINNLAPYKGLMSLPVFIDYEAPAGKRLQLKWAEEEQSLEDKGRATHTAVINAFCETMTKAGYWAGVYANLNALTTRMNVTDIGRDYYIWEARYNDTNESYTGRLNCWQYTSKCANFADYLVGKTNESTAMEFVTRLYEIVLKRTPDQSGLNYWVDQLKAGTNSGSGVAYGFCLSDEITKGGLTNEEYIERLYRGLMGRESDADGKASWVAALDAGASYEYAYAGFVKSAEFSNLCKEYGITQGSFDATQGRDRNINVTKFVGRLYTKALGRSYDVDGLNDWSNQICNNPSRDNILHVATVGFLHSQEFSNKGLSDEEYVKVLYRVFLDREYDDAGLADWTNRLKNGLSRDEAASGFAYSQEFSNLMTSYGL